MRMAEWFNLTTCIIDYFALNTGFLTTLERKRKMMPGISPRFFKSIAFWTVLRSASMAAFAGVVVISWGRWGIEGVDVPDPLMYTNLGNLLFWAVWLMGLVVLTPLFGRLWCGVCPLGALNEIVSRWGLSRPFPRSLRNDYPKAVLMLATLLLMGLYRLHHYPGATALYLAAWGILALLLGLVFSGRSLCSYVCPIGGMLGLYSRVAPVEVTVRDRDVCEDCESRDCIRGSDRWIRLALGRVRSVFRLRHHPCPVNLSVWDMKGTGRCLGCFNCLRACPHDNVQLSWRTPLTALWTERYPRYSEIALTAVLLGFLLLSYSRFWPALGSVLAIPVRVLAPVVGTGAGRVLYLVWVGLLLPGLLIFAPSILVHAARAVSAGGAAMGTAPDSDRSFPTVRFWLAPRTPGVPSKDQEGDEAVVERTDTLGGLTAACLPMLLPIILGGHLVLALVKLNAKLGYLPLGMADPVGIRSYLAVEELELLSRPHLILSIPVLRWITGGIMAAGIILSLAAASRISGREDIPFLPYVAQIGLVGLCLAGGLYKWLF